MSDRLRRLFREGARGCDFTTNNKDPAWLRGFFLSAQTSTTMDYCQRLLPVLLQFAPLQKTMRRALSQSQQSSTLLANLYHPGPSGTRHIVVIEWSYSTGARPC